MAKLRYRRVLLKIGGEALMGKGKGEYGIDLGIARNIAKQIALCPTPWNADRGRNRRRQYLAR